MIEGKECPEDIGNEEVEETVEETLQERTKRRTSYLALDPTFANLIQNLVNSLNPVSVPVYRMYGSLLIDSTLAPVREDSKDLYSAEFLHQLRKYKQSTKNYCHMFLTKSKIFMKVTINLLLELLEKHKDIPRKWDEATTKLLGHLLGVKKPQEILDIQELFKKESERLENGLKVSDHGLRQILNLVKDKDSRIVEAEKAVVNFNNNFSSLLKKLGSGKRLEKFTNLEQNITLLEFNLILHFESFRRFLMKDIIANLFEIHRLMSEHCGHLKSALQEVDVNNAVGQEATQLTFALSSIIDKKLKHFIKKKIGLAMSRIMKDEDLLEFFQHYYQFSYPAATMFVQSYLVVSYETKEKKTIRMILIIDSFGSLMGLHYNEKLFEKPHEHLVISRWFRERVLFVRHCSKINLTQQGDMLCTEIRGTEINIHFAFKELAEFADRTQGFKETFNRYHAQKLPV